MCTNARYVFNPYIRRKVLVSCGKCDACKQEKACSRSARIRNNVYDGEVALFVTLTYRNEFIPYVRKSDLYITNGDVPVYRDSTSRLVYSRSNGLRLRTDYKTTVLENYYIPYEFRCHNKFGDDIATLSPLRHGDQDKVGVLYYKDFQLFLKRLRQILIRNYNYEDKFKYFVCGEYGETFHRPHLHALLYIRKDAEEIFPRAILASWPYADSRRAAKYIEVAKDAACYISSYVNSHLNLLPLLSFCAFKPFHHYSKDFGVGLDCFSLPEILSKIDRRDLHYYRQKKFDGNSSVDFVQIPQYVLNRYFPRHKGFSKLTRCQLSGILLSPESASLLSPYVLNNYLYTYTPKETYKIYVSLENAYQRFHRITNLNRYDYAIYYQEAWALSAQTSLKDSLTSVECTEDWNDFYFNALDAFENPAIAPSLDVSHLQVNPNALSDVVTKTSNYLQLYDRLDKQRKVTNFVLTSNGHLV